MPVADDVHRRYGGHTTCIDIEVSELARIIIDCGTGLRAVESTLPPTPPEGFDFHVLLTHYHWDHLQGLPFFRPLYDRRNRFIFYGHTWEGNGVEELVAGGFGPPWFPVSLSETASAKRYVDVDRSSIDIDGFTVTTDRLDHPQGVTAYRIQHGDRSVVVATDVELGSDNSGLVELARDAEVLIHDAQYLPREYDALYRGWGHSTWEQVVEAAVEAGAKRVVLVSHDPDRTDAQIEEVVRLARARFPLVDAGYEGMTLEL